jgi:ATP-binding cassette, subfamily B, bacterial PglK
MKIGHLIKLFSFFNRREIAHVTIIFGLILLGTVAEIFGIGVLLPFLALLTSEKTIEENRYINEIYSLLNFQSYSGFLVFCSFVLMGVYIFKNIFLFSNQYIQARFLFAKHARISSGLFRHYLYRPYTFHLQYNTATLLQNIKVEVANLMACVFIPSLFLLSECLVSFGLFIFLLWIDWTSTLIIGICFGGIVFIFRRILQKKLAPLGRIRQIHDVKMVQQIMQGFGGIKETKLMAKEPFFIASHFFHLEKKMGADRVVYLLNQAPRFFIETVVVIMVLSLMVLLLLRGDSPSDILIKLSIFGVAAFRLTPSMGRILSSLSTITYALPSLDLLYEERIRSSNIKQDLLNLSAEKLPYCRSIEFSLVDYYYPNSEQAAINGFSLEIPFGSTVGIVGLSGAGKTTIVDLLLGLHTPTSGTIKVDGIDIKNRLADWQKNIGYIPQEIYLTDESMTKNIAFGLSDAEIDMQRVNDVMELAQLRELLDNLPDGLETEVGERGVRISGGQRQRVGIARALYHDPKLLIMDEATAALDNVTEKAIMESVEKLSGEKTVIMIAHRLTTIINCDLICFMKDGNIADSGSYQELLDKNYEFRNLANLSEMNRPRG